MKRGSLALFIIAALATHFCISDAARGGLKGRPKAPIEEARGLAKSMAKAKKRRRNQAFVENSHQGGGRQGAPAAPDVAELSGSGSDGDNISDEEIRTTMYVPDLSSPPCR
jgi:hypothetical protein